MAMLTVKPLEWDENATARTPFGTSYTTHQRADGMFEATVFGSFIGGPYGALEAARAACQADFEHRINSVAALSPDAINALVEAAKPFAKVSEVYPGARPDMEAAAGNLIDPRCPLTVGDFHRIHTALATLTQEDA